MSGSEVHHGSHAPPTAVACSSGSFRSYVASRAHYCFGAAARLTSPSAVAAAMKMPFTIDEAGADIEVADPDFITSKEIRVMPPSPAERPTRSKREAPLRSPDNVQTKTRRTRASPTSVVVVRRRAHARRVCLSVVALDVCGCAWRFSVVHGLGCSGVERSSRCMRMRGCCFIGCGARVVKQNE